MDEREILLAGTVGSTAYGLATENSDIDTLGIYRATEDEILGLDVGSVVDNSVVTHEPDVTLHEVGKFLNLALKSNPTILELLWLPDYTVITAEGEWLIESRDVLVSEKAVRGAYGGYALQQANRLMNRRAEGKDGFGKVPVNRIAKHARHCGRLIHLGQQLLETGNMDLDCTPIRDDLFALGELAVVDEGAFYAEFERRLQTFDAAKSVLPAAPDRWLVNRLLVQIRRRSIRI